MSAKDESPDEEPEDDAPDQEPEDEAGDRDAESEPARRKPLFHPPDDDEYDYSVRWFQGQDEDADPLILRAQRLGRDFLARSTGALAVRFTGGPESGTEGASPNFFSNRVLRFSRLTRWVTNSAYPGSQPPRVLVAVPGSLSVVFGVPRGEERMRDGTQTEFPTIVGARAVTRLLSLAGDEDELLEATRQLSKRAVKQLSEMVEEATVLALDVEALTGEHLHARLTHASAERALTTLNLVPKLVARPPEPVVGILDRPDRGRETVKLSPLRGSPLVLRFTPELAESIRAAWGKCIVGRIVVEEPEIPTLPRAPRKRRSLVRIDHVYDDISTIPDSVLNELGLGGRTVLTSGRHAERPAEPGQLSANDQEEPGDSETR